MTKSLYSRTHVYADAFLNHPAVAELGLEPSAKLSGPYREIVETLDQAAQMDDPRAFDEAWAQIVRRYPHLDDIMPITSRTSEVPRLLHADALKTLPEQRFLIPGMLPEVGLTEIHGAPNAGKSLFVLDQIARIAQTRPVVYVAAEGAQGYAKRVDAWETLNEQSVGDVYFYCEAIDLLNPAAVESFIAEIFHIKPVLVVIDTLARCLPGDENSSRDMGDAIRGCDQIRTALKAAVLLVHHTTKSTPVERGSGALRGACDSMIEITKSEKVITVTSSKLKDGTPFTAMHFQIVEVGDSVALAQIDMLSQPGASESALSPDQRSILVVLAEEANRESGMARSNLGKAAGLKGGSFDRALSGLHELNYVAQTGERSPHIITQAGLEALNA